MRDTTPSDASTCGCCAGTHVRTPAEVGNQPGLPAITYRIGDHGAFKASLLARLAAADVPALAALGTRADDDFTIAYCDAVAVVADVLTFYQERLANEAFLRTATERRSILELGRLIGYEPSPGVAASTALAFVLDEAPGAPPEAARPVTVPVGTRVQSVPGAGALPQTFETVGAIEARPEWNAMAAETRVPQPIAGELTELYLAGTGHQLHVGDVILIVGRERERWSGSEQWDARPLATVEPDDRRGLTRVTWLDGLGSRIPPMDPAKEDVKVFVLRQRASLFGHNAIDGRLVSTNGSNAGQLVDAGGWKNYAIAGTHFDLDASYPKVVASSWVVLVQGFENPPTGPGHALGAYVELYRPTLVSHRSRTAFGLSGRVTRIVPDTTEHLSWFDLERAFVLAQSEALPVAELPLRSPVYGTELVLAARYEGLAPGQLMAVSGKRQRLRLGARTGLVLERDEGDTTSLSPGDVLSLARAPERVSGSTTTQLAPEALLAALAEKPAPMLRLRLIDRDGAPGTLEAPADAVSLVVAGDDDPIVSEVVQVNDGPDGVVPHRDRTTLVFEEPLRHCYDRETVRVNANVAPATHGETVEEILGSGDASTPHQRFALKQAPLTHVSAPTASGRTSTLEVRVNELAWTEVPTLYGRQRTEHVFTARREDDGTTIVATGDTIEGARLPTGQSNVRARYRRGLGAAGNVEAGRLTTLLTRPLGVISVVNPEPATGGQDAATAGEARRRTPRSVLTLERAVSLLDYEDLARDFASVGKASAAWLETGGPRGVLITVAGTDGVLGAATATDLAKALRDAGDERVPITLLPHVPVPFTLRAKIAVAAEARADLVLEKVRAALLAAFGFEMRDLGQLASLDEIVAVMHRVRGVVAVDVDRLSRPGQATPLPAGGRLVAARSRLADDGPAAAELLVLDPATLDLGVIP